MASRFPTETVFDRITQEILQTFDEFIQQLIVRRDQLLAEVEARKNEFEERMKAQGSIQTLEIIRSQLEQLNTQQNPASNQIQSSLSPFQKQIDEIIQPPNFKFECQTEKIVKSLKEIGFILLNDDPKPINYSIKVKASHVISCSLPTYLYMHSTDLYVIEDKSRSIRVFDANDRSSKHTIKKENLTPMAVVVDNNHCYVAYYDYSNVNVKKILISKVDKNTLDIIQSELLIKFKENSRPDVAIVSMAISEDEIYVAESKIFIRVFDKDLHYRRRLELNNPRCIQFKDDKLYVLNDSNSLTVFNSSLQKIGSSHQFSKPLTNQNSEGEVKAKSHNVRSFCIDPSGNAILATEKKIVVQSPSGEELYTIGKNCQCNEDISGCSSVGVYEDRILVACKNLNSIKIF